MPAVAQAARQRSPDAATLAAVASAQRSSTRTGSASGVAGSRASSILPLRPAQREDASGKRMYRTSDGRRIELPPDMTVEEAARLESEAKAAEKHLGKGPPSKPVPDVRKLADKSERKQGAAKLKGPARPAAAGKRAAPRTAGFTARLKAGGGQAAHYLRGQAAPVLAKGATLLRRLSQNEQSHDSAAQKLSQAECAVVVPASEGQSKSNAGQVGNVGARPAPDTDANKGKLKLQETLAQNVPQSIEDVDNFKRDKKAQHMGADVLQVVQGDKNAVVSTFADMERTPQPTPPETAPAPLPPAEAAPATSAMNLGQGAVAPLQAEHTDVSRYTKEADAKLTDEGVTQEQLDMVDSGDLAAANKEKKGLDQAARTEPLAVQKLARQETARVNSDLLQEEAKERGALATRRRQGLGLTAQKQKGAKSAFEKKRDEVAAKINGIYKGAQDKVRKKLADLETLSMKRFDDGNARATRAFEDSVNREIDAFKADRYSGFFGWARKAKDWLLGMDDLPQVKAIFERNRATFVASIGKLVADISADNQRVVQECKDELARARTAIDDYVAKLGPSLKDIGKKAAGEVNSQLDELDGFVKKKEAELQQKLADKQQAAIKAIDDKIEKMKEAMSGALAKLGKLLLWAAKKFFTWALGKFGYSLGEIEGIINKGAAVLKAIFTKPIVFVKNLMRAAILGFENFGKNFLKHLKNALFEWLTGSLEGLVLPKTWNFQGIVGVALQMIGISYQNIRKHLVTALGEPVVAGLEKTFTLVKTLVTEGPMAAWEQLKEMAADMRDAFVDAVKDFIKWKVVEEAIKWVVALFIPGAGIIKAIIGIYDTVVFFIQKAKQIATMISNFLGSMGEIAAGNIGAAATAMENGLARGLSLVISFLAQLLHLNGITAKIRAAIQKIRYKVDAVLAKVATWIGEKAKKLFGAVKAGVGKLFNWASTKAGFKDESGKGHSIHVQVGSGAPKLMIASTPMAAEQFLDFYVDKRGATFRADNKDKIAAVRVAISAASKVVDDIARAENGGKTPLEPLQRALLEKNVAVSGALAKLIDSDASIGNMRQKYLLEGITGTYESMPKPKGDSFTADHQPQAAILQAAAEFDYFSDTGELAKRASSRALKGYAINLHHKRHTAGTTYGGKGKTTKDAFLNRIKPLVKGKKPPTQRLLVLTEIKADLQRDVLAMKKAAAPTSTNWPDIAELSAKKEEKDKLIMEISGRISASEDQIAAQDVDSLLH